MNQIDEYFTSTKVAELKTEASEEIPPFVQGGGWDKNKARVFRLARVRAAEQKLEVYDAREKLAHLATMIEDLKLIENKVEAIQDFAKENGLDDMVSFCCWSDTGSVIHEMMNCNIEDDAVKWMHSNHSC